MRGFHRKSARSPLADRLLMSRRGSGGIMRGSLKVGLVVLFSAFVTSSASASPIVYSETFDPADVFFASQGPCASGHHLMLSDECGSLTWTYTFSPVTDTISSALLTLEFADDGDQAAEKFDLWVNGVLYNNEWVTAASSIELLTTLSDGTLTITLARQLGDFWFQGATLTATGDPLAAVTPGTNTPGTDTPGTNTPGTNTPGTNTPGNGTPGTGTPEADPLGTDTPASATPTASVPEPGLVLLLLTGVAGIVRRRHGHKVPPPSDN
jgi:hypothetical protein